MANAEAITLPPALYVVKSFVQSPEYIGWWELTTTTEGAPQYLIHNNWVVVNSKFDKKGHLVVDGTLVPGDEVEIVQETRPPPYRNHGDFQFSRCMKKVGKQVMGVDEI